MWQGCWIRLWTVTSSLCSMSRLVGWFLLRKITKHRTYSTYVYIKEIFGKTRKTSVAWSFLRRKLLNYIQQFSYSEIQQRCFSRNPMKALFTTLKVKKALMTIMKENVRFKQFRLNYLNKQNKRKFIYIVTINNIGNMHAIFTKPIEDILH